ncbi:ribokinase, putative [Ichthyophthirius multifiliis]|uniref:Ribokinase, putative n=1 Tax=Ichthyophthirius multifiliis TaxID=5932 RepID=G0QZI4_ICHMU|nr:ribokinase, putative [Ichthyophthirius multifiliis]EGR29373.1 ribokinase, putative [Ichthyophthirius multifiliis]|eukprot:XP_004030609.1 ribokinase, putative [Ichthyophthirius multifiliis]
MEINKYSICVICSGSFDLFLIVPRFPVEGETMPAKKSYIKNGGKGANQAVAASKLGSSTIFAGQFGKDVYGQNLVHEMQGNMVETGNIRLLEGVQTGQAIITLTEKGENSIIIVGGANTFYESEDSLPLEYQKAILQSRFLLLQKEIPLKISTLAAQFAKKYQKIVMLDCGGTDEKIPENLMKNLDFISPNSTELQSILGWEKKEISTQEIREQIIRKYKDLVVVLKKGSDGSEVISENIQIEVPSITQLDKKILDKYTIKDTVGAGDCFTAVFLCII